MYVEIVGWLSSLLLLLTIGKQIHAQWKKGTSKGVSTFLFIGQLGASTGFLIYSILLKSWVFIVTNGLMMVSAMVGIVIVMMHRRREKRCSQGSPRESGESGERLEVPHGAAHSSMAG
jgi:MtN3 and saliva related transmembrane protein